MGQRRPGMGVALVAACAVGLLGSSGCMPRFRSKGGGQIGSPPAARSRAPADVAVPVGYDIELVAAGLTYPTGVTWDDLGDLYVVESGYAYGEDFTVPRLLRLRTDHPPEVVSAGQTNGPWNGVAFAEGAFFVAEGGVLEGGRVLRITRDGAIQALVDGLPSFGDHHTNGPVVKDGWVYFGQGVATNSGVVGEDSARFGWLSRRPDFHDVPCEDITLAGQGFTTKNPLQKERSRGGAEVTTGAFLPFGSPAKKNQVVRGRVPCSGAIMRVPTKGGKVELWAWGFRNPFGLAFTPDGQLYATDNGFDERGSRPIFGAADMLWRVERGAWYGWPDFAEGRPIWLKRYAEGAGPAPQALLAKHPGEPPAPVAYLAVHSSSDGLDFSWNPGFGYVGQAFIAQFGDQAPAVGNVSAPVGFKVVRVDVATGVSADFVVNRKDAGPASKLKTGGLERPVAVRFNPTGDALYIVDFGVLTMDSRGSHPVKGTGAVWRVVRRVEG